ncbi:hypothetical protein [Rossellomorea marisflavi]|uniref:hypothetical protein n=1 Tax=Rossellomorea marisflavi TaxID=189381 RepID=UPI003F9F1962
MKKIRTNLMLMWQSFLDALGIKNPWTQMALTAFLNLLGVLGVLGFGIYGLIKLFI